jgi:hypothetical protein
MATKRPPGMFRRPYCVQAASHDREIGPDPPIGGFFMTTKPDRSRSSTRRLSTMFDITSFASWTRFLRLYRSA